jgi:hypothetical protein
MANIDLGASYTSMLRSDVLRGAFLTFTPSFKLLPEAIAPFDKQLRVFVDGTEKFPFRTTDLTRLTSDFYTLDTSGPSAGVRCWGIRYTTDAISESTNDEMRVAMVTAYDQDNVQITWDGSWRFDDEDTRYPDDADKPDGTGEDGGWSDNTFNTDPDLGHVESLESERVIGTTNFPRAMDINRIGWTESYQDADHSPENMKVEVNVGTPTVPNWIVFGDSTLHVLQNVALAHTPGADSIGTGHYPARQDPMVAGTDDIWFDWTVNFTTARDLDIPVPLITVDAGPDRSSERVMVMRETRQDRPWIRPTSGARALSYGIWWYFEQIRFIVEELCELDEVSNFLGLPLSTQEKNDYSIGNQSVTYTSVVAEDTFDISSIDFLEWVPGSSTLQDQMIVEKSGGGTAWETVVYTASPQDNDDYNIVGDDIVLGAVLSTNFLRIRRVTRTDQYWVDLLSVVRSGWNSAFVDLVQRQARFMIEESCYLPAFFNDSPLSTSIFPRNWNWFRFVGTRNTWTIPGGVWGGGGGVIIFVNNVEQVEGTNYTIEGPVITWITTPPGSGVTTTIGVGGGGFGGGVGGGNEGEGTEEGPTQTPTEEVEPVDWPPNNIPPDCGMSLTVGSVAQTHLASLDWEGGPTVGVVSFSQGNATSTSQFGSSPMRIQMTVTTADKVSNGGGGFYPVGATDVIYVNKICNPQTSNVLYSVASAWKADPGDAWSADDASAALGCLSPGGSSGGLGLYSLANCTVSSTSPPSWRLYDSLQNIAGAIAGGDIDQVPYMGQYKELLEQADAFALDGGGDTGFTGAQFEDFVDPDTEFTDFDIPLP